MFDARSDYWQILFKEESWVLTMFSTVLGGTILQARHLESTALRRYSTRDSINYSETYRGQTQDQHEERLTNLLERTRDRNLKLNRDISKIRKLEVLYIGHVLQAMELNQMHRSLKQSLIYLLPIMYLKWRHPYASCLRKRSVELDRAPWTVTQWHQENSHRN